MSESCTTDHLPTKLEQIREGRPKPISFEAAIAELESRFPGDEIVVVARFGKREQYQQIWGLSIGNETDWCHSDTWPEAFEKAIKAAKARPSKADALREQAAKLRAEAEELERQAATLNGPDVGESRAMEVPS